MRNFDEIQQIVRNALREDIRSGDITTDAVIAPNIRCSGSFLVKAQGVIAGLEIARITFEEVDPSISYNILIRDGANVGPGTIVATVEGRAAQILKAERTALNLIQRMSGIATLASIYAQKIRGTRAKVIDTRKTAPGLRVLDKLAVTAGGCTNHRIGLYDMFLIKDNHIAIAGSIAKAVALCKEYKITNGIDVPIEVEADSITQVREALSAGVDRILVDNFPVPQIRQAVLLVNRACEIEASGGITLDTIEDVANTGVDFISVGALTHSARALDVSLDITVLP